MKVSLIFATLLIIFGLKTANAQTKDALDCRVVGIMHGAHYYTLSENLELKGGKLKTPVAASVKQGQIVNIELVQIEDEKDQIKTEKKKILRISEPSETVEILLNLSSKTDDRYSDRDAYTGKLSKGKQEFNMMNKVMIFDEVACTATPGFVESFLE